MCVLGAVKIRMITAHMIFWGPKIKKTQQQQTRQKQLDLYTLVSWHAVKLLADKNSFNTHTQRKPHLNMKQKHQTSEGRKSALFNIISHQNYPMWIFMSRILNTSLFVHFSKMRINIFTRFRNSLAWPCRTHLRVTPSQAWEPEKKMRHYCSSSCL